MTVLRWIARLVFVVALLTWVTFAVKASRQPESWPTARRRTAAFLVMAGAGTACLVLAPKKSDVDEEETY